MTVNISKPAINVAEKLAELEKPTGVAGEAMLRAETPQEQFNLIGAGRKNILINGDFQVSQRGDYSSATTVTSLYYWLDRWIADFGTVTATYQQTDVDLDQLPSKTKGAKAVATSSATGYMGIRQKIENPTNYIGRTFTYSAWVKSNNPNARLFSYIQGSTNQLAISDTHSGGGAWEKLSLTLTMTGNPTTAWFIDAFIANSSIGNIAITSGDYIEITAAQLELGKVATPFEHRSYGEELALCQRYFQVAYDHSNGGVAVGRGASGGDEVIFPLTLPVCMRANPTPTSTGQYAIADSNSKTTGTVSSIAFSAGDATVNTVVSFLFTFTGVVCDDDRVNYIGGSGATKLTLDAEL